MKTVALNNKIVKLYDSIDEMPIVNFQKYNKYLLIDSGIGSDVDDIDSHIVKIAKLIRAKDEPKAMQELQNLRQGLMMVSSNISPKHLAFAALIHSIDGEEVTDLSDDSLKDILEQLNKAPRSKVIDFLLWLKKKICEELEVYFPENFDDPREKESYDRIKGRTLLVLDSIVNDTDNEEQLSRIDSYLFGLYQPKNFLGSESAEIKYDRQFESACLLISQKANMDARKMTVLQFYSALDLIKKQAEAEAKGYNKLKNK